MKSYKQYIFENHIDDPYGEEDWDENYDLIDITLNSDINVSDKIYDFEHVYVGDVVKIDEYTDVVNNVYSIQEFDNIRKETKFYLYLYGFKIRKMSNDNNLNENHFDLDPYGEEDWDDRKTFLKWLEQHQEYKRDFWNYMNAIDCGKYLLTSLDGLENLPNLVYLYCNDNELTSLEGIEKSTKLTFLNVSNNQLTSLEGIENLTNLEYLYCSNNQLTSLDGIENLINLKRLTCYENQFTKKYEKYLKDYCKKNNIEYD